AGPGARRALARAGRRIAARHDRGGVAAAGCLPAVVPCWFWRGRDECDPRPCLGSGTDGKSARRWTVRTACRGRRSRRGRLSGARAQALGEGLSTYGARISAYVCRAGFCRPRHDDRPTQLPLHPRVLIDPRHGLGSYHPGVAAVQECAEVGGRLRLGGGDLLVERVLVAGALDGGEDADRGREAGRAEARDQVREGGVALVVDQEIGLRDAVAELHHLGLEVAQADALVVVRAEEERLSVLED